MFDDKNLEDRLAEANRLHKEDKYEEEISIYNEIIKVDPNCFKAYSKRSGAFHRMRRYDEAIQDLNILIKLRPGSPSPFFTRALWNVEIGKYELAIEDLDFVISTGDYYFLNSAYFFRSLAYFKISCKKQALEDCAYLPEDFSFRVRLPSEQGKIYTKSYLYDLITALPS